MIIVAGLDIATTTGVCVGSPGQTPEFFSVDLGIGKSHDVRFSNVMRMAHRLISERGVTHIGIESPIIVPRRDKKSTNELLMGLNGCVRGWAALKGVPAESFEIARLDVSFLGYRAKGRANRKAANIARCRQIGWNPATDDEADAGAVFNLMCSTLSRSYAVHSTPLFSGGVSK